MNAKIFKVVWKKNGAKQLFESLEEFERLYPECHLSTMFEVYDKAGNIVADWDYVE